MKVNFLALLCLALLPALIGANAAEVEPDLQATTSDGIHISIFSELSPLEINKIHSWRVVVSDPQGNPLDRASLSFVGGMPDHDHGLPTQPQVTTQTGAGTYLLEGVRFHMPGRWQITVSVGQDGGEPSQAIIEFSL